MNREMNFNIFKKIKDDYFQTYPAMLARKG